MSTLRFRLPGRVQPLGNWLASLLPAIDRHLRRRLIEDGGVRLDGRIVDRSTLDCPPGAMVEINDAPEAARPEASTDRHPRWQVIVDRPPWTGGAFDVGAGAERAFEFTRGEVRGELACLLVSGAPADAGELCEGLARASMPVVGDLSRGGLGVPGGPRIAPIGVSSSPRDLDWPDETVWRAGAESAAAGDLLVSRETGRALQAGHPWILPDDASDPATRFHAGSLVRLVERGAGPVGWAHVEAAPRLAARLWAAGDRPYRAIPSVEARVAKAIARRRALLVDVACSRTNAFRLIHGEGDGLPGLFVDRLGPMLRVLVSGWASEGFRERVVEALGQQLPVTPEGDPWSILEVLHLRRPGASHVDRVRWVAGGLDALAAAGFSVEQDCIFVHERGLRFAVDPGWHSPRQVRPGYGLFVDQRDNRERVAGHAAGGGRWLNLFAHTGAFSVALLAAGAEHVVSVDLSAAYLERLERNLTANLASGIESSRHETLRGEARRYLEELDPSTTFRGIVIDPPTAAAAGRRFWSVRQDLEPLLRLAIDRLEAGGVLLVTQNRAGPPLGLDGVVERVLAEARRRFDALESATAGMDHPSLKGFPQGDPFEGWLVTLR